MGVAGSWGFSPSELQTQVQPFTHLPTPETLATHTALSTGGTPKKPNLLEFLYCHEHPGAIGSPLSCE